MADNTTLDLSTLDPERRDIITLLRRHRGFLLQTVTGMNDEQATSRSTVSELTLAGLVKHVAAVEAGWTRFIVEGPSAMNWDFSDPEVVEKRNNEFKLLKDETLESVIAEFQQVADRTDRLAAEQSDLSREIPLPEAPWFEPGTTWSVRRVLLHILAETSQHAGHADIIREAIDGSKTMG